MNAGRRGRRMVAWVAALVTAVAGVVVAASPASASPQATAYVQKVYSDLLGRSPDADGLRYWSNSLDGGVPRSAVASALVTSDEYRNKVVTAVYQQLLGRAPDADGLGYWRRQIAAGVTFEQFQALLLASDEYYANPGKGAGDPAHFVDALYRDALGRAADAAGRAYFVDLLRAGRARGTVVAALVFSREHLTATVQGYYRHFLGRSPDAGGLGFWVGQLAAGRRDEVLIALIIGSDEYFSSASPPPVTTTTTSTTTTSTTTPNLPPPAPTISLVSSDVSGANVTLTVATSSSVLDVTVDEPLGTKLTEVAPGPGGRAVVTVAGLAVGAHALQVRGRTVPAGQPGGVASNLVTVGVTIVAPTRAVVDLPDDVTGDQVHVMYVVPSDGTDRQLDVSGAITNSIAAWNGWLTAQTGGSRMRLDTFDGVPDVTFVRLAESDAAVAATGDGRGEIEADLHALGFNAPGKVYAVYYDGSAEFCGAGAYPPTLIGNVAALYLQGVDHRVNPPAVCAANPVGADGATPGYFDYSMLHEVVHTLGFVAACAPHISVQAHVDDSNHDLMYSPKTTPAAPWQFPAVLDSGRDDYYRHSIPGCLDLARSAFLAPLPTGAQPPPGWTTAGDLSVAPDAGGPTGPSVP